MGNTGYDKQNEAFAQIKKPFPPKRHATSNQSITESMIRLYKSRIKS